MSSFNAASSNNGHSSSSAIRSSDEVGSLLNQHLGPEYLSLKQGKFVYITGYEAVEIANAIFGWDGWSHQVVDQGQDMCEERNGKWTVVRWCTVRVTVYVDANREVFHEGVGTASMDGAPSALMAIEKCRKEAETDALKRALKNFGNATGNGIRCAEYRNAIRSVKVGSSGKFKLDVPNLRRKEHLRVELASTGKRRREAEVEAAEVDEYGDEDLVEILGTLEEGS